MEIKAEQLTATLNKGFAKAYLISSDEFLLQEEACEEIIARARGAGYTEKERLIAEKNFSWSQLAHANATLSLFGEKKIIDLRIPNGKPGKEGSDAIVHYLQNASEDNLLLIRCPQLNQQAQGAKWVSEIKKQGVFCLIWKVKTAQLPRWIMQRCKQRQLTLEAEAAQALAERVEGNLLAAHQEIEKLGLLFPENATITLKQILQSVANHSRYDVFEMVELCLQGNGKKALQMYRGLREERTELPVLFWALKNELETLLKLFELSRQSSFTQACNQLRIWQNKQGLYQQCMKRLSQTFVQTHIIQLSVLDKAIKGQIRENADTLFEAQLLALSGIELQGAAAN